MSPVARPFAPARAGIRLAVRVTPKASADRVIGVIADGRGGTTLKASVTAAPEDGKANGALVQLLARHFGVKPRDIAVTSGAASRDKVVDFAGDPGILAPLLEQGLEPWLRQG